jgi:hypothetical protein
MSQRPLRCKALSMNGAEGLLIILGVVVVGGLVVYAIVRLSDRW